MAILWTALYALLVVLILLSASYNAAKRLIPSDPRDIFVNDAFKIILCNLPPLYYNALLDHVKLQVGDRITISAVFPIDEIGGILIF